METVGGEESDGPVPMPVEQLDLHAEIVTRDRRIEQLRAERDAFAKNFELLKVRTQRQPVLLPCCTAVLVRSRRGCHRVRTRS